MAIILFCRNGHDLSTRDPIFIGQPTAQRQIAIDRQAQRDILKPRQPFCTECGAATLDACQHCHSLIVAGPRPTYCGSCGEPFPWTETTLETVKKFTDQQEGLTADEKEVLKGVYDDLTHDTPTTKISASWFNDLLRKLAPHAAETIRKTVIEIVSSTTAKIIKP